MDNKIINLLLIIILFIIMIYLYNVTNDNKKNIKELKENNRTEDTSSETIQTVGLSNYYTKSAIDQNTSELRTLITNSNVSVDETSNLFRAAGREELGFEIDLFGNLQVNSDVNFTRNVDFNRNVDFTESSETTFNGNLFMEHGDNSKYFDTLPPGTILSWRWNVDSSNPLPLGWALCDGQNGTPDLRGRFVLGAGQGNRLTNRVHEEQGGDETVTLDIGKIPSHDHKIPRIKSNMTGNNYERWYPPQPGQNVNAIDYNNMDNFYLSKTTGGGQPHNNMPPYYVLVYIMKLNRYGNNTPNNPYNSPRQSTFT
jgi:microcystin-dependent protein